MALTTVLRFSHTGGNTDFYTDEVKALHMDTVQPIDLWNDAEGYFHHYKYSGKHYELEIEFNLAIGGSSGTIEKIEDLWDQVDTYKQPEVMTCFYEYKLSTTNSIQVQMMRDEMVWSFFSGKLKLSEIIPITFIEAVPEGVAVHRKRVGV